MSLMIQQPRWREDTNVPSSETRQFLTQAPYPSKACNKTLANIPNLKFRAMDPPRWLALAACMALLQVAFEGILWASLDWLKGLS